MWSSTPRTWTPRLRWRPAARGWPAAWTSRSARSSRRDQLRGDDREQRLEQLPDDPVGELALELAAAGREHPHPRRAGNRARLGQQARLADAGSALDDDEPPAAAPRGIGQGPQRRDLDLALQQQAGGSARRNDTRRRHHNQSGEPSEPTV